MWQSGSITAQTLYWFEGAPEWRPLINILALLEPKTVPVAAIPPIKKPLPPQVGRAYRTPAAHFVAQRESDSVVTTQLTSKRLKLQQAFAFLLGLVGVVLTYICWFKIDEIEHRKIMQIMQGGQAASVHLEGIEFAMHASMAIIGIAAAWLLITSIRIWWKHG